MSPTLTAELDREIRRLCEQHGVTRAQILPIVKQLLDEKEGREQVVFRAVEEPKPPPNMDLRTGMKAPETKERGGSGE